MNIIINGQDHDFAGEAITYEQVVDLANTRWGKVALHSITYHHKVPFAKLPGERDGMLCPGQSVPVSPGMYFSAAVTGSA